MAEDALRLADALRDVDHALRRCRASGGGAPLVDRTCLAGSLARGTFSGPEFEPAAFVAFVNLDLQFGAYDVPEALDVLAAEVRGCVGGTKAAGVQGSSVAERARPRLCVKDAECRGGLWVEITLPGPGGDATRYGADAAAAGQDAVVQIWLAENMRSGRAGAPPETAAPPPTAAASIPPTGGDRPGPTGDQCGVLYDALGPVDPEAALGQQRNGLGGVERAARDAARLQARQAGSGGGTGTAAATGAKGTAAWAARLSCGFEEARRLFWSRQPPAALRAAAAAHRLWHRAAAAPREPQGAAEQGSETSAGGSSSGPAGSGGGGAGADAAAKSGEALAARGQPELAGGHVLHLLDLLALHASRERRQLAPEAGAAAGQAAGTPLPAVTGEERAVVRRLFELLAANGNPGGGGSGAVGAGGGGRGLYVAFGGGGLAQGAAGGGWGAGTEDEASLAGGGGAGSAPGTVVLDPCVPALNVYAAACEAVGGAQRLQELAAKALELALSEC
ncbi:hypothetical protein TSOC_006346 [Tetrabaena socialis]|uniref:Uncharacterized protein n=1 Tax=Tetrabaena socialis TaxID=47790 RepID=A0A2J7ZKM1_9CHLO|nr:hypothetical protein TSOC_013353 [Tetrabaena socialis]PNH07238.1 hypothetical protein TSOC_006346 [Tetrabaena socialis]|eukprot:PNH00800.1 hypothetical protein TSOC_013353 [Tetrabaena socialis]